MPKYLAVSALVISQLPTVIVHIQIIEPIKEGATVIRYVKNLRSVWNNVTHLLHKALLLGIENSDEVAIC